MFLLTVVELVTALTTWLGLTRSWRDRDAWLGKALTTWIGLTRNWSDRDAKLGKTDHIAWPDQKLEWQRCKVGQGLQWHWPHGLAWPEASETEMQGWARHWPHGLVWPWTGVTEMQSWARQTTWLGLTRNWSDSDEKLGKTYSGIAHMAWPDQKLEWQRCKDGQGLQWHWPHGLRLQAPNISLWHCRDCHGSRSNHVSEHLLALEGDEAAPLPPSSGVPVGQCNTSLPHTFSSTLLVWGITSTTDWLPGIFSLLCNICKWDFWLQWQY